MVMNGREKNFGHKFDSGRSHVRRRTAHQYNILSELEVSSASTICLATYFSFVPDGVQMQFVVQAKRQGLPR